MQVRYNMPMREFLKTLIPEGLLKAVRPWYHGLLAWDASVYYERPSEQMVVIGITGTAGKSTTTQILAHILNSASQRTGYITTVGFFDGRQNHINKHGLSMPNEIRLQKQLRAMAENGCRFAVIECTSEGLAQNRHAGINFDMALVTNLSPAHMEAHGGFEQYRAAKAKLFEALERGRRKSFFPKKIKGLNLDDPELGFYLQYPADETFGISFGDEKAVGVDSVVRGRMLPAAGDVSFEAQGKQVRLKLPGKFNAYNALLAMAAALQLGVSIEQSIAALQNFSAVDGRMEAIANSRGIRIYVDYAPEPAGMRSALEAARKIAGQRLIHVFGATGGHRDKAKRYEFGEISAQLADVIIITNDDVYDSDPEEIARNVEEGIQRVKDQGLRIKDIQVILDRRQAVRHALELAKPGDTVIITGKGSEQFLVLPGNRRVAWDEREVVREELQKLV